MFSKLFGKGQAGKKTTTPSQPPAPKQQPKDAQNNVTPDKNAIALLFPGLPKLELAPSSIWSETQTLPVKTEVMVEGENILAFVYLGQHKLQLAGFSMPLPEAVQQHTIHFSNWAEADKETMYNHRSHVLCFYEEGSSDPIEQLFALYKVASLFVPHGLLGIADETAMTANPTRIVQEMFAPLPLESLTNEKYIPLEVWTGILKLFRPDGMVWYTTRGFERFNVPDLAYLAPKNTGSEAMKIFSGLLRYMVFYQARLEPGHTADMGQHKLHFKAPYEYGEYIQKPGHNALVVEKM